MRLRGSMASAPLPPTTAQGDENSPRGGRPDPLHVLRGAVENSPHAGTSQHGLVTGTYNEMPVLVPDVYADPRPDGHAEAVDVAPPGLEQANSSSTKADFAPGANARTGVRFARFWVRKDAKSKVDPAFEYRRFVGNTQRVGTGPFRSDHTHDGGYRGCLAGNQEIPLDRKARQAGDRFDLGVVGIQYLDGRRTCQICADANVDADQRRALRPDW